MFRADAVAGERYQRREDRLTELADDQKLVERELNRINRSALPFCASG